MMYKLKMSIYKEMLLLKRDFGGLVILFVMPLILIVAITLIQDNAFKKVTDTKMPIVLVDKDGSDIAEIIRHNLQENGLFEIISEYNNIPLTEEQAKESVFAGDYQLAIIIPEGVTTGLQEKVDQNVNKIVSQFGFENPDDSLGNNPVTQHKEVKLYFDPATQLSFKNSVKDAINQMISKIETQSIYKAFQEELGEGDEPIFDQSNFIVFKEIVPKVNDKEVIPNSVQHNVPAWALFAIFFIVVPLSINLVKEKSQGTHVRMLTNPTPYYILVLGKTATYLIVCYIQFLLMVAIGVYLFPYLGLPVLELQGKFILMSLVAIFSGLAAIGFSIVLGTIANTQEQSAPFGATSVVILAAIGGVWVPVFAMPKYMQYISNLSPMNWGLSAFYDVVLRNGKLLAILPELIYLFLFFIISTLIAILYDKKKRAV